MIELSAVSIPSGPLERKFLGDKFSVEWELDQLNGNAPESASPRRQLSILADGAKLRSLRRARRLTQLQLAALSDVSERTVRTAESSKRIKIASLESIALALGAELIDLASYRDELLDAQRTNETIDRVVETFAAYVRDWDLNPLANFASPHVKIDVLMTEELDCTGTFRGIKEIERLRDEAIRVFDGYSQEFEVKEIRGSGNLVVVNGDDILHNVEGHKEVRMHSTLIFTLDKNRIERVEHFTDSHAFFRCLRGE